MTQYLHFLRIEIDVKVLDHLMKCSSDQSLSTIEIISSSIYLFASCNMIMITLNIVLLVQEIRFIWLSMK